MLSADELAESLRVQLALGLRPAWVAEAISCLKARHPALDSWSQDRLQQELFGQFLLTDLNVAGQEILPSDVQAMHKQCLSGKFVLQVDEVVNMAASAKDRYSEASDGNSRMLKLMLTDGRQRVVGIEFRPIKTLSWQMEAGTKVLVHDVDMRRGVMLLQPHNVVVLGGRVDRLEAARARAVAAWNKPQLGRRPNDPARDPFAEAQAAAWADDAEPQDMVAPSELAPLQHQPEHQPTLPAQQQHHGNATNPLQQPGPAHLPLQSQPHALGPEPTVMPRPCPPQPAMPARPQPEHVEPRGSGRAGMEAQLVLQGRRQERNHCSQPSPPAAPTDPWDVIDECPDDTPARRHREDASHQVQLPAEDHGQLPQQPRRTVHHTAAFPERGTGAGSRSQSAAAAATWCGSPIRRPRASVAGNDTVDQDGDDSDPLELALTAVLQSRETPPTGMVASGLRRSPDAAAGPGVAVDMAPPTASGNGNSSFGSSSDDLPCMGDGRERGAPPAVLCRPGTGGQSLLERQRAMLEQTRVMQQQQQQASMHMGSSGKNMRSREVPTRAAAGKENADVPYRSPAAVTPEADAVADPIVPKPSPSVLNSWGRPYGSLRLTPSTSGAPGAAPTSDAGCCDGAYDGVGASRRAGNPGTCSAPGGCESVRVSADAATCRLGAEPAPCMDRSHEQTRATKRLRGASSTCEHGGSPTSSPLPQQPQRLHGPLVNGTAPLDAVPETQMAASCVPAHDDLVLGTLDDPAGLSPVAVTHEERPSELPPVMPPPSTQQASIEEMTEQTHKQPPPAFLSSVVGWNETHWTATVIVVVTGVEQGPDGSLLVLDDGTARLPAQMSDSVQRSLFAGRTLLQLSEGVTAGEQSSTSLLAAGQAAIKEFYGSVALEGGGAVPPVISSLSKFHGPDDAQALLAARAAALRQDCVRTTL